VGDRMLTKADIVLMYITLLSLYDKGYTIPQLFSGDEKQMFNEVIKKNEISDSLESAILLETFDELLRKAGIRLGEVSTLLN
jgi:hypothetical protein